MAISFRFGLSGFALSVWLFARGLLWVGLCVGLFGCLPGFGTCLLSCAAAALRPPPAGRLPQGGCAVPLSAQGCVCPSGCRRLRAFAQGRAVCRSGRTVPADPRGTPGKPPGARRVALSDPAARPLPPALTQDGAGRARRACARPLPLLRGHSSRSAPHAGSDGGSCLGPSDRSGTAASVAAAGGEAVQRRPAGGSGGAGAPHARARRAAGHSLRVCRPAAGESAAGGPPARLCAPAVESVEAASGARNARYCSVGRTLF